MNADTKLSQALVAWRAPYCSVPENPPTSTKTVRQSCHYHTVRCKHNHNEKHQSKVAESLDKWKRQTIENARDYGCYPRYVTGSVELLVKPATPRILASWNVWFKKKLICEVEAEQANGATLMPAYVLPRPHVLLSCGPATCRPWIKFNQQDAF
jgi:hypothetical protein